MSNLKKYKLLHWVYNLLHYRSLAHNRAAYRKYDFHKPVIASLSSKDFPDKTSRAWLDTGHSRELTARAPAFGSFPSDIQQQLLDWSDKGYLIWERFFDDATIEGIEAEVDSLIRRNKLKPTH